MQRGWLDRAFVTVGMLGRWFAVEAVEHGQTDFLMNAKAND